MKQVKLQTEKMLFEIDESVSWITFNQPEKRNAISLEMWEGLASALELAMMNDEIKVCLLYTSPSPRDLSTSRMPSSA